ncbi:MAG: R2-like ligand-binding oxidase [Acidobacteriota bacterium]
MTASDASAPSRTFQSTSARGLDFTLPPMRLWEKAKRFGVWNPSAIDFTRDAADWAKLRPLEQTVILHLTSLFQGGEESVTLDLLPLIGAIADEGRLEEEMFLTAFLWEEAKHVEVFRRFLDDVAHCRDDLSTFHGPNYRAIFHEALPQALGALRDDPSPVAQARASVTYNMIVEGVLAETGYHGYHQMLTENDLMPGMCEAVGNLKRDESRHMAYGVYLLSRLVAEHGDPVWEAIEDQMTRLLPHALGVIEEIFEPYEAMPFDLDREAFLTFGMTQFQRRLARIEKSREQTLDQVNKQSAQDPAAVDASSAEAAGG